MIERKQVIPQKSAKLYLNICVSTWHKDSHGLYDYQSFKQAYKTQSIQVEPPITLYHNTKKQAKMIQQISNQSQTDISQLEQIAKITKQKSKSGNLVLIEPIKNKPVQQQNKYDPQKTLYYSLRNSKNQPNQPQTLMLNPGMTLKFGRIEYRIIEMREDKEVRKVASPFYSKEGSPYYQVSNSQFQQKSQKQPCRCKICLCDQQLQNDPLISPCLCKGSILKIHLSCLRQCIDTKIKKQVNNLGVQYNFSKFVCELCKHPYPRIVKVGNQQHQMMRIQKPQTMPYIIFETINSQRYQTGQSTSEKSIFVVTISETGPTKIGRAHNCQIRLTDISVSRNHAEINIQNKRFVLKDTNSKFGTLLKIVSPVTLNSQKKQQKLRLQYGRSLFEFNLSEEEWLDLDTQGEGKMEDNYA